MQAEIVMIGTELLLGQIVDTNAAYMGRVLAENGVNLFQKTTVGDNRQRIIRVLDQALDRADAVLTSGGLGPTEDDLTRDCVAEVTGRPLEFQDDLYEQLKARFAYVRRPFTKNNEKQAYVPHGATPIPNPNGTAPGLIAEDPRGVIICMPGVPRELYAMLDDSVVPYLRERFELSETTHYRTLKVCGLGESRVDALIGDLIQRYDNPKIGLLANPEWVRIRLSARAPSLEEALRLMEVPEKEIRDRLPGLVMGVDDETLEIVVDALFGKRGWTFATAETYTGGMMAQRLTVAGARQFLGGWVEAATVEPPEGLVGKARAMAQDIRSGKEADCGLAVVGAPSARRAAACFLTPEGRHDWEFGFAQVDDINQLRSAVITLERVRRILAGVPESAVESRPA